MTTFFETDRLRVRRFTDADVDAFVSYRADPDVARYQSWSDYTSEQGRALVESMREAEPGTPGDWFQLALEARETGELVGDLALHVDVDEPRQAEVGFTLDPAQQGHGYATEALDGFLDWIFPTFRTAPRHRGDRRPEHTSGTPARARRPAPGGALRRQRLLQGRLGQ